MIPSRRETDVAIGVTGGLAFIVLALIAVVVLAVIAAAGVAILVAWSTLHVLHVVDSPAPWAAAANAAENALRDASDG